MTQSTPPGARRSNAAGKARSRAPISSFTAIRIPWKERVAGLVSFRNRAGYQFGERVRARERPGSAGRQDRPDQPAPVFLLAKVADRPDEHLFGCGLEPCTRGDARPGIHSHVNTPVTPKRENARRPGALRATN